MPIRVIGRANTLHPPRVCQPGSPAWQLDPRRRGRGRAFRCATLARRLPPPSQAAGDDSSILREDSNCRRTTPSPAVRVAACGHPACGTCAEGGRGTCAAPIDWAGAEVLPPRGARRPLPDLPARRSQAAARLTPARPRRSADRQSAAHQPQLARPARSCATRRAPPTTATARRSRPACARPRTRERLAPRDRLRRRPTRRARARPARALRRRRREPRSRGGDLARVPDRLPRPARGRRPVRRRSRRVRTPWGDAAGPRRRARSGRAAPTTPRAASATLDAYVRFAERAGSQQLAFTGDPVWSRGAALRAHPRAARAARACTAARATTCSSRSGGSDATSSRRPGLLVAEDDPVTLAAKRVFGIGDRMTLERRARELARGRAGAGRRARPGARELGAHRTRITQGVPDAADAGAQERARAALGL